MRSASREKRPKSIISNRLRRRDLGSNATERKTNKHLLIPTSYINQKKKTILRLRPKGLKPGRAGRVGPRPPRVRVGQMSTVSLQKFRCVLVKEAQYARASLSHTPASAHTTRILTIDLRGEWLRASVPGAPDTSWTQNLYSIGP